MYRIVTRMGSACLAATLLFMTPLLAEERTSKEPSERDRDRATQPQAQEEEAAPRREQPKPKGQREEARPPIDLRAQPAAAEVLVGLSNRSSMPISIEVDAANRVLYVRSWLTSTATTVFQGETRQISIPSGAYQLLADGVIAGPPMTVLPGRSYSIELLTQADLMPKAVQVRMLEEQRTVLTSWIGPRGGSQVVILGQTAVAPIYQMRFICPTHPTIVSTTPSSCAICSAALVERSVIWAPAPTQTVLLHVCPRHEEVQSAFAGDCAICSSRLVEKQVLVTGPLYVVPAPVRVRTMEEAR